MNNSGEFIQYPVWNLDFGATRRYCEHGGPCRDLDRLRVSTKNGEETTILFEGLAKHVVHTEQGIDIVKEPSRAYITIPKLAANDEEDIFIQGVKEQNDGQELWYEARQVREFHNHVRLILRNFAVFKTKYEGSFLFRRRYKRWNNWF